MSAKTKRKSPGSPGYDTHRENMAAASRKRSASGRDVGPLPGVVDPARRASCQNNFRLFCETYLPERFRLAWSPDHLKAISRLQTCILEGGQFAFAMPRGSGKTSLCEAAALWGLLYGHRRFVVMIGSTADSAVELLDSVKAEIEGNERLAEDFPEICHPVRSLEGISNRSAGQTLDGIRTRIVWTGDRVALPTVADSVASGSVLAVAGITGRVRGLKHTTADGSSVRPDLCFLDDPQTDESANSPTQNAKRERVVAGAVLGLAGPGTKIAAVMPCTVISPGDLADRILDIDRNPAWQGERFKMMYAKPTAVDMWDRYADMRRSGLRAGDGGKAASDYYRDNKEAMRVGAQVAWEARFNPDEVDALEHAMRLMIDNPRAFQAEYQNEPLHDADEKPAREFDPDMICKATVPIPRRSVPVEATRLTAFIDVGGELLWYAVTAWDESFGGVVIDYGTFPTQSRAYFAASEGRPTLSDVYTGLTEPQRVYAGLRDLSSNILGRRFSLVNSQDDENRMDLSVSLCLIDSGWQTDTVQQFTRESEFRSILIPSKGYASSSAAKPIREWAVRPGERAGRDWRLQPSGRGRLCLYDPDSWKSFVCDRLSTPPGGGGSLRLFQSDSHQLFADHLACEFATRVSMRGRTFDKWNKHPGRTDNHWLDCLVGSAVAASVAGLQWSESGQPAIPASVPRVSLAAKLEETRSGSPTTPPTPTPTPAGSKRLSLREILNAKRKG